MSDTTHQEADKTPEELAEYWTEERRRSARPKPMPTPGAAAPSEAVDDSGDVEVIPPNTSLADQAQREADQAENQIGTPVPNPGSWPQSCNGKLFFDWKGDPYVGSAEAIYLDLILTAGHNVYDEGAWSTNFQYVPAYPGNQDGFGWSRAAIFTAWRDSTNYAYDYAMIKPSSLMTKWGSVGAVTGLSPQGRTWRAIGYPGEPPYTGQVMEETTGSYLSGSTIVWMNNNDLTQGSSGGAWWTQYNGQSYPNGVQSHRNTSDPITAASPYLNTTEFKVLVQCAGFGSCQ